MRHPCNLAKALRNHKNKTGISYTRIAKCLGKSTGTIYNIIAGIHAPRIDLAENIAKYLKVDLKDFDDVKYAPRRDSYKRQGKFRKGAAKEEQADWQGLDFGYM